jgi:hypothetical protein
LLIAEEQFVPIVDLPRLGVHKRIKALLDGRLEDDRKLAFESRDVPAIAGIRGRRKPDSQLLRQLVHEPLVIGPPEHVPRRHCELELRRQAIRVTRDESGIFVTGREERPSFERVMAA